MSEERGFWGAVGGRKMGNGYLAFLALTIMAIVLEAEFGAYAIGVLAALGITNGSIAFEDQARAAAQRRPRGVRRSSDPPRDTDIPEAS